MQRSLDFPFKIFERCNQRNKYKDYDDYVKRKELRQNNREVNGFFFLLGQHHASEICFPISTGEKDN